MSIASHQDIADLLLLSIYQDDHLSLDEESALKKALGTLGWDEIQITNVSTSEMFSTARAANTSEETKDAFIAERTQCIKEAGESSIALDALNKVLSSDSLATSENEFLKRIEKMLA